jgi:hypothetical protein
MTIRAKFRVSSVEFFGDPAAETGQRRYTLNAVHDTSTEENRRFTKYTPMGELKMTVDNPAVRLVPGELYYLDFTPAEA